MGRRCRATDQKDPHVFVGRPGRVEITPPEIVQCILDRLPHRFVNAIGHQSIEAGTFIDLIKVWNGFSTKENAFSVTTFDRWTRRIIQSAFNEITRGHQVFEPLLILNTDGGATEIIGDPDGRDIHFALSPDLFIRQIFVVVASRDESEAFLFHPLPHLIRLFVAHLRRFVIQCRLTQPLFVDSSWVEQMVWDDGIEHPHAAFVKDSHNCLVLLQLVSKCLSQLDFCGRKVDAGEAANMRCRVFNLSGFEPFFQ